MLNIQLTTPERVVFKESADSVTLPTVAGEITVLPTHAPLVGVLSSGVFTITRGGVEEYVAVSGGFFEVQPGSNLVVLADAADRAEELDLAAVEAARARAEKALENADAMSAIDSAALQAALQREMAKLKVLHRHSTKRRPHVES